MLSTNFLMARIKSFTDTMCLKMVENQGVSRADWPVNPRGGPTVDTKD
jgi:hypothetical protein